MDDPQKMKLTSMDIADDKQEQLKTLFPEIFSEGKIDFDQLKRALGEWIEPSKERFGLQWPGKAECMKIIQQSSVATLKPCREESVNFDVTENIFIEGDNLEVLKLLQKSYFGKIKMIYIDPPYNTGKEFIYPDKYSENLDTYLAYTGQVDDSGKKFSTNTEAQGRFHSRWLNMMYPRLYLARNLLNEDGIIFISIDDHEIANLKELCNQIFGEENFVAHIIWQHSVQPKGYTDIFSVHHNHILCYRKSEAYTVQALERTDKNNINYSNPDNDPRGLWRTGDVRNALYRQNLIYPITTPSGKTIQPPPNGWRWSKETLGSKIKSGEILFSADESRIIRKIYLADQEGRAPETIWFGEEVGTTREGSRELKDLFDDTAPFDTVKPIGLIKRMLQIAAVGNEDIVLDFFAGSCSTAHAVLDTNKQGKFIVVQLPEYTDANTPHGKCARDFGLKTISEVSKERIRRAIKKISDEQTSQLKLDNNVKRDLGVKVFKLARSNFKIWEGNVEKINDIAEQLTLHVDHIGKQSTPEDILYEILLKAGFSLATKIKKLTMIGKQVFSIEDGVMLICLENEITPELIDALAEAEPLQVICLDEAFKSNDQLKANAVQTFKARAQAKESEIVFRTI